ncbi:8-amino-7-oxononanoate synthase [Candidatus Nitrosoglobus terrae]|uniref:8-amino-7-oxononanoate synthase n=1 Tax=Candidatus Nitrosoglobus terrae TaxID=1630141 RepID=A0A1Q2SLH2_9GAMM|nr:8-amino-7-oxononanoate synthase [Candidatus Nitrosoglobus terrae]BAW79972.1 8-amino-7-oxononanoate synthase [Candidatus Nitrosoglobus terrae]
MSDLKTTLKPALDRRKRQSLYRYRRILESPQGPEIQIDGRQVLTFCSNDYLGLANHPQVRVAFEQGVQAYGVGSGAAHLVSGHSRAHHALEEALAEFVKRPCALLFSTGYMANLGLISTLLNRQDMIFEDRLNHASLLDGGKFAGAGFIRYRHRNYSDLAAALVTSRARRKLIATDGVFSMDGDLAPLTDLSIIAHRFNAWLMVDDAHGLGVLGEMGRGSLEHFGLGIDQVPILVGTLGKALGTFGAFVAGEEALIETLIQQARTYIYTTAPPAAVAAATLASLRLAQTESWRRDKLAQLIAQFRQGAADLGLQLLDSHTPIQPLVIGDSEKTLKISEALLTKGILITPIRPPTVPTGSARLRITLTAAHAPAQVERLLEALADIV